MEPKYSVEIPPIMAHPAAAAGVYIHFPFCLRKCPYCDFASEAATPSSIDHSAYAAAVVREACLRASSGGVDATVASIYVGGGTPSLWAPESLGRVLKAVREEYEIIADDAEVTVECNPSSLDAVRARAIVEAGANRLSVGVQSVRDEDLAFLGRLHDAATGMRAVEAAMASGACRVSADLMHGLPRQSPSAAIEGAVALVRAGVGHVSAYLLSVEDGTEFGRASEAGTQLHAHDDVAAASYLGVSDALVGAGFHHYEISNFCRLGEASMHNTAVWRGGSYVGLGAGAVGFVRGDGGAWVRYRNTTDSRRYMEGVRGAKHVAWDGTGWMESVERIDVATRVRERIMLGLRTAEGINWDSLAGDVGEVVLTPWRKRAMEALVRKGRLRQDGPSVWIPREQWLWESDTVARLI